ncbi:MAG: class II fumarate hydratase, partial [Deltaproteobacteria bacterium]|nr:class II fumarate hydratase [Deltaproteobacteria bacterium]
MRDEKDSLGPVSVPEGKYYGPQTQRALENFRIGDPRFSSFPTPFIRAYALVKKAAAAVNRDLAGLDPKIAHAIDQAADEITAGQLDDHFPLLIWQSGSGTQFNMNVNEVIAHRAAELLGSPPDAPSPVHPNDHVNLSQSTNDTFPTAMHLAAVTTITHDLLPALAELADALSHKAAAFQDIIKIGRTHLQDATPLTLGQEFSGYAAQITQAAAIVKTSLDHLYPLAIGATAVGTGLNSPADFDTQMVQQLSQLTNLPFRVADNKFAALAAHDAVVNASGALKTLAGALMKIADDLRWLASGPRAGLGEITLPANEPGSSIMPGKINPTQCEMLTMVACQVFGNDTAITTAGALGKFELNTYKPLMAFALLQSISLLADACRSFTRNCVVGIEPNRTRIDHNLHQSLMLVTALNQHIGYDKAAKIALKAFRENKSLKQAALELAYLTEEQF